MRQLQRHPPRGRATHQQSNAVRSAGKHLNQRGETLSNSTTYPPLTCDDYFLPQPASQ
jgi:hypothetical protein